MRRIAILLALIALLTATGVVLSQASASFRLPSHVIAGGGQAASSASYRLHGTLGQDLASLPLQTSSSYRVASGFWPRVLRRTEFEYGYAVYLPLVLRQ